mgnify:CR=1 FL=1
MNLIYLNQYEKKGYADMQSGHTRSAKSVFTNIRKVKQIYKNKII